MTMVCAWLVSNHDCCLSIPLIFIYSQISWIVYAQWLAFYSMKYLSFWLLPLLLYPSGLGYLAYTPFILFTTSLQFILTFFFLGQILYWLWMSDILSAGSTPHSWWERNGIGIGFPPLLGYVCSQNEPYKTGLNFLEKNDSFTFQSPFYIYREIEIKKKIDGNKCDKWDVTRRERKMCWVSVKN